MGGLHDFWMLRKGCGGPQLKATSGSMPWLAKATLALVLLLLPAAVRAQQTTLEFTPAHTRVGFTLGDVIHTVHGSFDLKHGTVHFNPETGEVNGEIVLDAASGQSGNRTRDRKMNKEVLQSDQYPEIIFRPDRVDGKVGIQGTSTIQIHGVFSIHGADHEMSFPMRVELTKDHWIATGKFTVPYVKWGLKNPSTFILRVSESVEIDLQASSANFALPPAEAPK